MRELGIERVGRAEGVKEFVRVSERKRNTERISVRPNTTKDEELKIM